MTKKHTDIMTFQQKCTNLRDIYLVKKWPKKLGIGKPPALSGNARKFATFFSGCLPLLEFDDKKKLHNGGNISNTTDDNGDNLVLLDCEEHRPKWKRAPNLFQECWNRNGKDERLGEINFRNTIVGKGKDVLV